MKFIIFINRLAIICNLCFIVGFVGRFTSLFLKFETIGQLIAILGFTSIFVNSFVIAISFGYYVLSKKLGFSKWMLLLNIAFLLMQLLYFFTNNKTL
jgi:hypothetical protein